MNHSALFVLLTMSSMIPAALAGEPPTEPILRIEVGAHTAKIHKAAITREGLIVTVSEDKTTRVWTPQGKLIQVLRVPIGIGDEGALYAVAASPRKNVVVVGGWTGVNWDQAGAVYALALDTGKITARVGGLPGTVEALAYSKDGQYLAISTAASTILRVLNVTTGATVAQDTSYGQGITAIAFLPDGRLVTTSQDHKVHLYDTAFRLSASYQVPGTEYPWRIAVAPQGDRIAVGLREGNSVHVLSTNGLKLVARLTADTSKKGGFSAVAWVGNTVYAAGTYREQAGTILHLWDLTTGREAEKVIADDLVTDLVALPDGNIVFTTAEPSVGVVQSQTLVTLWVVGRPVADFRDAVRGTFAVSKDGTVVAFGMSKDGRVPYRFDMVSRTLTPDPALRPDMGRPIVPKDIKNWHNQEKPVFKGRPVILAEHELSRAVAASPDGRTVLLGADFSLKLFRNSAPAWNTPLSAAAWAVNLTRDGYYALAALGDGTIRWYDTKNGAESMALFVTAQGQWIVWTSEGFFDHSPDAEGLIGYHMNKGKSDEPVFVSSEQIYRAFFRPDLVALKAIHTDVSRAIRTTGNAGRFAATHPAPQVELVKWCLVNGKCQPPSSEIFIEDASIDEITLYVTVTDAGSGIGSVLVRRNNAAVRRIEGENEQRTHKEDIITIPLALGVNYIMVTAFDASNQSESRQPLQFSVSRVAPTAATSLEERGADSSGVLSSTETPEAQSPRTRLATGEVGNIAPKVISPSQSSSKQSQPALVLDTSGRNSRSTDIPHTTHVLAPQKGLPDLYVLSIGVNKYLSDQHLAPGEKPAQLDNAVNDSESITAKLQAGVGILFNRVHITELTDERATKTAIESAIESISHATTDRDYVVVFISGHGNVISESDDPIDKGQYYFFPYDFENGNEGTLISQDEIAKLLTMSRPAYIVLLLDTCFSGKLSLSAITTLRSSSDTVKSEIDASVQHTWVERLSRDLGRIVIAGTNDSQEAADNLEAFLRQYDAEVMCPSENLQQEPKQHGLFTSALLYIIDGGDSGRVGRKLTADSLFEQAKDRVDDIQSDAINRIDRGIKACIQKAIATGNAEKAKEYGEREKEAVSQLTGKLGQQVTWGRSETGSEVYYIAVVNGRSKGVP